MKRIRRNIKVIVKRVAPLFRLRQKLVVLEEKWSDFQVKAQSKMEIKKIITKVNLKRIIKRNLKIIEHS